MNIFQDVFQVFHHWSGSEIQYGTGNELLPGPGSNESEPFLRLNQNHSKAVYVYAEPFVLLDPLSGSFSLQFLSLIWAPIPGTGTLSMGFSVARSKSFRIVRFLTRPDPGNTDS